MATKITIYWDEQDEQDAGWAYRLQTGDSLESGSIDDLDDLARVLRDAGDGAEIVCYERGDDRPGSVEALPTFGGEPLAGEGIYSYDATRILTTGDYSPTGMWACVPRSEWR